MSDFNSKHNENLPGSRSRVPHALEKKSDNEMKDSNFEDVESDSEEARTCLRDARNGSANKKNKISDSKADYDGDLQSKEESSHSVAENTDFSSVKQFTRQQRTSDDSRSPDSHLEYSDELRSRRNGDSRVSSSFNDNYDDSHSKDSSRDSADESSQESSAEKSSLRVINNSNKVTKSADSSKPRSTLDEVVRKNLELLETAEQQARFAKEQKRKKATMNVNELLENKGISLPEKKPNETKNQKKKRRKKTRKIIKNVQKEVKAAGSDGDSGHESEFPADVQVDYVQDQVEKDLTWFQFSKVFEKFKFEEEPSKLEENAATSGSAASTVTEIDRTALKLLERKKPANLTDDEDEDEEPSKKKTDAEMPKLSKKKLKQLTRMTVSDLKLRVHHPELVEMHDVTAKDPVFLLTLKATRNSVPVPRHWCFKRKYLQGKRGIEKPPFNLPDFIKRTGICEMRAALQEKEDARTLKAKQREKIRPKMGKIDIDYQKLHDAFFKWQTKPRLSMHGDLYYEGKEFETRLKEKKPGELSDELRTALGMPTGPNAAKCPPPWLIAMQRYGPPPSYPNLKIPGLNAAIPEGCSFGYHAGGWGKPPVDETGKPLYGDVFGSSAAAGGVAQVEQDIDKMYLFGAVDQDASSSEDDESSDEDEDGGSDDGAADDTGLVTPAEGLATPSGLQSSLSAAGHPGLETPDAIELRKRKIEAEMEMGDQRPQLYTVLTERKVDRLGHSLKPVTHTYEIPPLNPGGAVPGSVPGQISSAGLVLAGAGNKRPVELALDPSELELDPGAMAARYEQTVREQQTAMAKEDFSDMVAEHAAKQKNKRKARDEAAAAAGAAGASAAAKKKYKEFKF